MDSFFQPIQNTKKDPHEQKDSFWVSPSLAAWLTGKDSQGNNNPDADGVKGLVVQAVDKTGVFKPDNQMDEKDPKGLVIDVDFTCTDHQKMKKLVISGDPDKRQKAVNIIKDLTSKCQKDSASSLIDSWQLFSDENLREKTPTMSSSRGNPRFGVMPGVQEGESVLSARPTEAVVDKHNGSTITTLRRNLVSKYERDIQQQEDQHQMHRAREHTENRPTQVLKLTFPFATLPLGPDIPKSKFEAELKKALNVYSDCVTIVRVRANFEGERVTADVAVPAGTLEDLRSPLFSNPPVVCDFKAVVPEKLQWCEICQKEHEPDKLCYKNFQTDRRFDERLTSFLGECSHMNFVEGSDGRPVEFR
jgi:hypothetical protein